MQDTIILANCIYDIMPNTFDSFNAALGDYKEQRYHLVKAQFTSSHFMAKLHERILHHFIFNWLLKWTQPEQIVKDSVYRPQVNFTLQGPQPESLPSTPQKPSRRIQKELEAKKASGATTVVCSACSITLMRKHLCGQLSSPDGLMLILE
ncbi:hypothetical protein BG015_004722 [Linnemannia schmuckeri]|uniref:Uncharacterized protein n=1 Tax=Linnemannia schmuckeri TaxID=64567 RepID=A0A9P5SA86_9FUNG|nr:hypothetical protein BG015_004722 [Linnemannia schmuckeri]